MWHVIMNSLLERTYIVFMFVFPTNYHEAPLHLCPQVCFVELLQIWRPDLTRCKIRSNKPTFQFAGPLGVNTIVRAYARVRVSSLWPLINFASHQWSWNLNWQSLWSYGCYNEYPNWCMWNKFSKHALFCQVLKISEWWNPSLSDMKS